MNGPRQNMRSTRTHYCGVLIAGLVCSGLAVGCAPKRISTDTFVDTRLIDAELHKGKSTKADVTRVLGAPAGNGAALLPTKAASQDVWFYSDIEMTDFKAAGGVINIDFRQQILLVFFDKDVFDGFMWYSNVLPTSMRAP